MRTDYTGFDHAAEARDRAIPRKEAGPVSGRPEPREHNRLQLDPQRSVHPRVERCFPTQKKVLFCQENRSLRDWLGAREMNQVSFVVLIVLGLALTGYFGLAAWRLSGEDHAEITGAVFTKHW